MNNILLISEDLLKSETIVNDNINSQSITPSILIAKEIGLQQVIGTKLYKKILTLVDEDTINNDVNVNYKIVCAADYGVPQMRKRLVFVGLKQSPVKYDFPSPIYPGNVVPY